MNQSRLPESQQSGQHGAPVVSIRERAARAIWAKRPDCHGKPWPLETAEQRRAYSHNPSAAVDLSFIYADVVLALVAQCGEDDLEDLNIELDHSLSEDRS